MVTKAGVSGTGCDGITSIFLDGLIIRQLDEHALFSLDKLVFLQRIDGRTIFNVTRENIIAGCGIYSLDMAI